MVSWPIKWLSRWRSGGAVQLTVDEGKLIFQSVETRLVFDLAAPDLQLTFHSWQLMRGTVLRISQGATKLQLACDGFPPLPAKYHRRPEDHLEWLMRERDFAALVAATAGARTNGKQAEVDSGPFLLWPNVFRFWHAVGSGPSALLLVVVLGLSTQVHSRPLAVAIAVTASAVVIVGARILHLRRIRPALHLSIKGDRLIVERGTSQTVVGERRLGRDAFRLMRWSAGVWGARSPPVLDCPGLVIEGPWPFELSVGSPRVGTITRGPLARLPCYLIPREPMAAVQVAGEGAT